MSRSQPKFRADVAGHGDCPSGLLTDTPYTYKGIVMEQVTIVGAGLSGLTAAIILAREGHVVTVLEQKETIGGASLQASAISEHELCFADMTPLDIDAMSRYLGFSLSAPEGSQIASFYNPLPCLRFRVFGKVIDLPLPSNIHMKMVNAGRARRPSMRTFFVWRPTAGCVFPSARRYARARTSAIFRPARSWLRACSGKHLTPSTSHTLGPMDFSPEGRPPRAAARFAWPITTHTHATMPTTPRPTAPERPYCFSGASPSRPRPRSGFQDSSWTMRVLRFPTGTRSRDLIGTPTGSFTNPRLYCGNLILAGTLSGMQDPSMVLGVHGALVSGRIAALAVHDRERATKEFRRMNRWWKLSYLTRRLLWATHPWGPRKLIPAVLRLLPHVDQRFLWLLSPIAAWVDALAERMTVHGIFAFVVAAGRRQRRADGFDLDCRNPACRPAPQCP